MERMFGTQTKEESTMAKLQQGDKAPDFEALSDDNQKVRLSDFRGQRVILYFYPKDDTKGCTTQSCLFRDHYSDFEAKNATILGISPDGVDSHKKFRTKYELPFNLLIDTDHDIAERFGAWGEKSMYGRTYWGIIRSHFVIDEEGTILDAQYKVSPAKSAPKALEQLS